MIELVDINIQVGNFRLQKLSFRVEAGEYVALMGRTGQGKTTILEAICGLKKVHSGCVLLAGVDVTQWSPSDREVGYVPQDLALFPNLNVKEHLAFALRLRKQPASEIASRVQELANLLGIVPLLNRGIANLSGGEAQRVALGRALSFRPRVLLLDEPLSALDQATRADMQALLKMVQRQTGVTTIHVTHQQEDAQALATRRLVLEEGRLSGDSAGATPRLR